MRKPKAKECRCWMDYQNAIHKGRCEFYECIKRGNRITRKTVCKLKEQN